ncbi:MAG: hypothetical protein IKP88_04310 [Lachnospiraceae bacterium]|nr:hypothetical protein [Lachnospiraceae bacterium]
MNEFLIKMLCVQKEIDKYSKKQTLIKCIAAMCVFAVFFCSFNPEKLMNIALFASIPIIIALYVLDSNLAKKNHSLEVDIYLLELENLKNKKKKDEKEEEDEVVQSNDWINSIAKPEETARLPLKYYLVLIALVILLWIIM